jgi:uncharacterized protein (TIGR02118 family)
MVKLIVLYGTPTDPAAFDAYYRDTHIPLAEKIPGVVRMEIARLAGLDGAPGPYHLQAELYFDSVEALQASMSSPEGAAAAADVANFATGGATMLLGQVGT